MFYIQYARPRDFYFLFLCNLGFKIVERAMFLEDLKDFEQCFITGTAAEVTPVCAIDDQNFVVGDEIKKISSSYIDLVNNWSGD